MKIFILVWFLMINFTLGSCIYTFNTNEGNSDKRAKNKTIGLKPIHPSEGVNCNKKSLEMKYHCSVTEGIPLPLDWARGGHAGGIIKGNVIVAGGNNLERG